MAVLQNAMTKPRYNSYGGHPADPAKGNSVWDTARAAATGSTRPTQGVMPGPAAAEPTIAPATNYDAMFRQSIDAQRGQIDSQLRSAMAALQEREAGANALVQRQPGEVNAVYDAAQPELDKAAAASAQTQAALNITPLAGDQAGLEPIMAANAMARAGRLSDLPYLQQGTQELYQRQRGGLEQAALAARGDIEGRQQDYYQQMAMQDRQDAAQKNSLFDELSIRRQFNKMDKADEQRAMDKQEKKALRASEPPAGTADWWKWYMQSSPNRADTYTSRHGGAFGAANRLMNKGEWQGPAEPHFGQVSRPGGGDATRKRLSWKEIQKRYRGNSKLLAALRYQRQRTPQQ